MNKVNAILSNVNCEDENNNSVSINLDERTIYVEGDIDDSYMKIAHAIIRINAEDDYYSSKIDDYERIPIVIYLDTFGGDLDVAESIVDVINMSITPITVIGVRKVYSAGSYILTTSPKGSRYLMKNATVLLHDGFSEFSGHSIKVESARIHMRNKVYKQCDRFLNSCKIPKKLLMQKVNGEWFLTAEEAIEFGLADYIVDSISDVYPSVIASKCEEQ